MKRIIFGGLMTALCAVSTQAQDLPGAVIDVVDTGPPDEELYDTVDDGDALAQFGINYLF